MAYLEAAQQGTGGIGASFIDQPLSICRVCASKRSRACSMQAGLIWRIMSAADLPGMQHNDH